MNQAFRPEERLHNGRDYGRVFHRQQKAAGRHAVVLMRKRGVNGPSRLGILVSVKVSKSAVRRHQLKRWTRECFRTRLKAIAQGFDLVVLYRSDPIGIAHVDFDAELLRLTQSALQSQEKPGQPRARR
jgi:ribonuclease P protein component